VLAILTAMAAGPIPHAPPGLVALRARIDGTLGSFLAGVRTEMAARAPEALLPIDEVIRLVGAGGKRLRPVFCYWGYRAAGGVDGEPIERAAAALELLHTMALIHDDLMDRSSERRGAPSSAIQLAEAARRRGMSDAERAGVSLALVAGDLVAVLADRLLLEAGFPPDRLIGALDRYHRMRTDMALGQSLDVAGGDPDRATTAALKGGSYTVDGPLSIGAALAGADRDVTAALAAYGVPLGLAFQLLDDERDGEVMLEPGHVEALVAQARAGLDAPGLDPEAARALAAMADLVAAG
jgi:geranylgeranyl diphosphate synthase, type I